MNTVFEAWLQFSFWPKTHAQAPMCELVRYHGAKSMIGFSKILCVSNELLRAIDSREYSLLMHHAIAIDETFDRTYLAFFGLGSSIGIIELWFQCHRHIPMIRHQL